MIESLHISNYALIDRIDIDFADGLNIITGETGAGKSIMLGALSLLLGERAEQKVIRDRDRKSVIEAVFSVKGYDALRQYCADNDIEWDDEQCVLRREVSPNGRSRAFINDSPVTVAQLRGVAMYLVDLHSQHQNLLLATADYQLNIIDALAGNSSKLTEYQRLFNAFKTAVARFRRKRREIEAAIDDEEYTRFQLAQLDELKLVEGEQEELERERDLLTNVADIKSSLAIVLDALSNGEDDAVSSVRRALDTANSLSETIEEAQQLIERLESARVELQDIAETFEDIDSGLNADPQRLEAVEERLNTIYDLERKHHVDTVDELIAIRETLREKIASITQGDDTLKQLEKAAKQAKSDALAVAHEISKARHDEAERFATDLRDRALPLGMKNLVVEIKVTPADMSATGIDHVEFLFAFNKNQQPLPVGDTASGGEISRLMLSIKSIVADKMQLPSIIFDEVDTGVSGDVARRMGEMMQQIARNIQVIAITHLPQVASKGNAHFKVYKEDDEQATTTRLRRLTDEQRVDELAVMLSGSNTDEAALAAARSLLINP